MSARINDEDDVSLVIVSYNGAHSLYTCLWVSGFYGFGVLWIFGEGLSWYLTFFYQPCDECLVVRRAREDNDCARHHD